MKSTILIRSYRNDRFFLDYCLRSIQKFAHSFSEVVVVLPVGDEPHFKETNFHGARVVWVEDPAGMPGYNAQQVVKMCADQYTESDLILITDSDTFAKEPFSVTDFCDGEGKPVILFREWDQCGDAKCWREPTQKLLGGVTIPKEYMAVLPLVYQRNVFGLFRQYIQETHGKSFLEVVSPLKNGELSEFNALGAYIHLCHPDTVTFRRADPTTDGYKRPFIQAWSWAQPGDEQGLTENRKARYEEILED